MIEINVRSCKTLAEAREEAIAQAMTLQEGVFFSFGGKRYTISLRQAMHLFNAPFNETLYRPE